MPTTSIQPGETLSQLSGRIFGGDVLRFGEILDLNPEMDVFEELTGMDIEIPDIGAEIESSLQSVTESSSSLFSQAGQYLDQAENFLQELNEKLPSSLQKYTQEALEKVNEINGLTEKAEQFITNNTTLIEGKMREYAGQLVQQVPWLLGGDRSSRPPT